MSKYSADFKANLVRRILMPNGPTAYELAKEVGVSSSALYAWIRDSRSPMPEEEGARRPCDWSPSEKLEAVLQGAALSDEDLGGFLRESGLHEENLRNWRALAERGLGRPLPTPDKGLRQQNKRLSQELARKDRALAEAAALLVLSKKARALWGGEGEDI